MFNRIVSDFLLNAFGLAAVPDDDELVGVVLDANHLIVVAIVVEFSCHNHVIFCLLFSFVYQIFLDFLGHAVDVNTSWHGDVLGGVPANPFLDVL